MSSSWHAIHMSLIRSTQTLTFQRRFEAMTTLDPQLRDFPDPAALLDRLHGPGHEPKPRNDILRALIAVDDREAADTLLLLALWPGLDGVRRRLHRSFVGRSDELAAEIPARTAESLRRLDLDRVTWIAATVIRNVERDIRRALRRDWSRAALAQPFDEALVASADGGAVDGLLARQAADLAGADADLVLGVAVVGESQVEAARRLRIEPEAARKRYQRALRRIRRRMAEAA